MKHLLFYAAVVVALIAAAAWLWGSKLSTKPTNPPYEMGKGRGIGTDFMDPSKASAGITPVKGNLGVVSANVKATADQWFGKYVVIKSTVPTSNPVRTQNPTIW